MAKKVIFGENMPVAIGDTIELGDGTTVKVAAITEQGVQLDIDGSPSLTISDPKTGQKWKNDGSVKGVIGSKTH